jgi:hypothetical protein
VIAEPASVRSQREGLGRRLGRSTAIALAVICGAALISLAARIGTGYGQAAWTAHQLAEHSSTSRTVPTSPQIEAQWGVRVMRVQLLADNGLVEVRYQVLDNDKANRMHADSNSLADIPNLRVEATGHMIRSNSLLFHIHHEWEQGADGRSYSIVYGNAGGALRPHALVTISMSDGLQLRHVPTTG